MPAFIFILLSFFVGQVLAHPAAFHKATNRTEASQIELVRNEVPIHEVTPAYVKYDFSNDKCSFHLNDPKNYPALNIKLIESFMYYHEVGHCDFYFHGNIFENPKIHNLLQGEILSGDELGSRSLDYLVLHEMYADAYAYSYMRKDGWKHEDFLPFIEQRVNKEFYSNHKTVDIFETLSFVDFSNMNDSDIKQLIHHVVTNSAQTQRILFKFYYQLNDDLTYAKTIESFITNYETSIQMLMNNQINDNYNIAYISLVSSLFINGVKSKDKYPVFYKAHLALQKNLSKGN